MTNYQVGDSIILQATFKNLAGVLADLIGTPTLKIYGQDEKIVGTPITVGINHPSTGVYNYDYFLASEGYFIYEFGGTNSEGTPIVRRGSFTVTFK